MAQRTARLDKGQEEQSGVTREDGIGRGGWEKDKEEKREQETDASEEKMEETWERGGEKRKGDAPQLTKASNEIRLLKKPSEVDPSASGKSPRA